MNFGPYVFGKASSLCKVVAMGRQGKYALTLSMDAVLSFLEFQLIMLSSETD